MCVIKQSKCVLLNNWKCMTQHTLNLHHDEYSQEFHYYPFAVKLDRCVGSCNILNDLSNSCGNGKYLASIVDDATITCDDIIKS